MAERMGRAQGEAHQLRAEREELHAQLRDIEASLTAGGRGERQGGWGRGGEGRAAGEAGGHTHSEDGGHDHSHSSSVCLLLFAAPHLCTAVLLPPAPPLSGLPGTLSPKAASTIRALQDQLGKAQADLR